MGVHLNKMSLVFFVFCFTFYVLRLIITSMLKNNPTRILLSIIGLLILAVVIYNIPLVNEKLSWRVDNFRAQIVYFFNPPEQVVFQPTQQAQINAIVSATLQAYTAAQTPSVTPTLAPTTVGPTATATLVPTPNPSKIVLKGTRHEYEKWNNCGPTTMAMNLSFWGWKGDQLSVAPYVKPNPRDKNVMPYEMADFVNIQTDFKALVRVGGDLETLKNFLAAGIPVIVEKGFEPDSKLGWMGHYEVITGYDDAKKSFVAQDSYIMPDMPVSYDDMTKNWRAFNFLYIVVYPKTQEADVMRLLGSQADETANFQDAAQKASNEIYKLTDTRDQFFAWYNRGTSLVNLKDYAGAAEAYDQAYTLYPNIVEGKRPWRMLWYQTGPYFAYYYTGRYYDVLNFATKAIELTNEPALEESYYWRGLAKLALGDKDGAVADFRESLKWHPEFSPTLDQLQKLGVSP